MNNQPQISRLKKEIEEKNKKISGYEAEKKNQKKIFKNSKLKTTN